MKSIRALAAMIALASTAVRQPTAAQTPVRWEGHRNRLADGNLPTINNDFGWRPSNRAGGIAAGEIGGYLCRSLAPATYSRPIMPKTLNDKLVVSGTFAIARNEAGSGLLIGWFNQSSRGWRSPNSLALRFDGNRNGNWIFFEYGTRTWKAGGGSNFEGIYQTTKTKPIPADGKPHRFRLAYDPNGASGSGELTLDLDGGTFRAALDPGHKADGAVFDRFGVICQQISGKGMEVYFDDLEICGERHGFDRDPKWQALRCSEPFVDWGKRPLQDFGLVARQPNETRDLLGGYIWRDESPSYFAQPIPPSTLATSLLARGRLRFASAGSDSGAYFGWFHAATKAANSTSRNGNERPKNQLAILIEGPSRAGFYFRPTYRTSLGDGVLPKQGPSIVPDGKWRDWTLRYEPRASGTGVIVATLDGTEVALPLTASHRAEGARFDRFGIFNHQTGGHYVELYWTDLTLSPTGGPAEKP